MSIQPRKATPKVVTRTERYTFPPTFALDDPDDEESEIIAAEIAGKVSENVEVTVRGMRPQAARRRSVVSS